MTFDATRARLKGPDRFPRLNVEGRGERLASLGLDGDTPLLVVERGGQRLALLLREMVYHHLAQGQLAGEPYLVSF